MISSNGIVLQNYAIQCIILINIYQPVFTCQIFIIVNMQYSHGKHVDFELHNYDSPVGFWSSVSTRLPSFQGALEKQSIFSRSNLISIATVRSQLAFV